MNGAFFETEHELYSWARIAPEKSGSTSPAAARCRQGCVGRQGFSFQYACIVPSPSYN